MTAVHCEQCQGEDVWSGVGPGEQTLGLMEPREQEVTSSASWHSGCMGTEASSCDVNVESPVEGRGCEGRKVLAEAGEGGPEGETSCNKSGV